MRTLSSVIVGLLGAISFSAFFLLDSALSYVEAPARVAETAAAHGLHERAMDAAELVLVDELGRSGLGRPALVEHVRREARAIVGQVLSVEWFYESLRVAYGSALAMVRGTETRPVDLSAKKAELARKLGVLSRGVIDDCRALVADPACDDPARRAEISSHVERAIERAVRDIPDTIAVERVVAQAGVRQLSPDSPEVARARRGLSMAHIARHVALGAMLLFFLVIGVSNWTPTARLFIAVGLALAVSAALYLAAVQIGTGKVDGLVGRASQAMGVHAGPDQATVGGVAARGLMELARGVAHDAVHGSDGVVTALGALGLVSIIAGVAMARRKRSARAPSR